MRINIFRAKRYILVMYRISTNVLTKNVFLVTNNTGKKGMAKRTANTTGNTGVIFLCSSCLKINLLTKSLVYKPLGLKVLGVSRIRPKSYFKTGTNALELLKKMSQIEHCFPICEHA
jgi:hypothetical protein